MIASSMGWKSWSVELVGNNCRLILALCVLALSLGSCKKQTIPKAEEPKAEGMIKAEASGAEGTSKAVSPERTDRLADVEYVSDMTPPEPKVEKKTEVVLDKKALAESYQKLICIIERQDRTGMSTALAESGYADISEWSRAWEIAMDTDPEWASSVISEAVLEGCGR